MINNIKIIGYIFFVLIFFSCVLLEPSEKSYGCMDTTACNYDAGATEPCTADLIASGTCDNECQIGDDCIPYEKDFKITSSHLEKNFNVCYGNQSESEIKISDFEGQVIWLQAVASW